MEVDRSFFLHDKPALDPRTGQLHKDAPETLEDGSPSVLRINAHCTIQARINEHGLPLVVVSRNADLPDFFLHSPPRAFHSVSIFHLLETFDLLCASILAGVSSRASRRTLCSVNADRRSRQSSHNSS